MPQKKRTFDPPVEVDNQVGTPARAGAAGPPLGERQNVLTVDGRYDAIDFYLSVPTPAAGGTWADATFELLGEVRGALQVLDRRAVADMDARTQGGAPARTNGVLFSVRGVTVSRFVIDTWIGALARPTGEFVGRAWFGGGPASSRGGRQCVDLFCFPWQQDTPAIGPLAVGAPTTLVAANPDGGRSSLTEVTISNEDAALAGVVELQRVTPAGVPTTIKRVSVLAHDSKQLVFPLPPRNARGGLWRINVVAGANLFVSTTPYLD